MGPAPRLARLAAKPPRWRRQGKIFTHVCFLSKDERRSLFRNEKSLHTKLFDPAHALRVKKLALPNNEQPVQITENKELSLALEGQQRYIPAMVPLELLGRALATLRDKHDRTQEEVANVAGVTPSMISNYERGKEKPSLESLWKILGAMNCSLIDLEAALRFVRGEAFPLHCKNWRIRIESDEYPSPGGSRQPSELASPRFDLDRYLQASQPVPDEAERYVGAMMHLILDLLRLSQRPTAGKEPQ